MDNRSEEVDCMEPIDVKESTLQEVCDKFNDMNMREKLLDSIYGCGFEKSTIEKSVIVPCVGGRDVVVEDQSENGKTATFWIACLQEVDSSMPECQFLILSSTRELATQIERFIATLAENMNIKSYVSVGGTNVREDALKLAGCHVVVGTPGRIKDMIRRKALDMTNIKLFVLDEAEELLSLSFKNQTQGICKILPADVQVILLPSKKSHDLSSKMIKSNDSNSKHWILEKYYVSINKVGRCKMVDIKDCHKKNGEYYPTKKRISLTAEQWKILLQNADEITLAIEQD